MAIAARQLLDLGNYPRYLVRLMKEGSMPFRKVRETLPVFVFGLQRSGTTMTMHVLQSCPDVLVYNEHDNNRVFQRCLLRDEETVQKAIDECPYPFVAFKPISDSHRAAEIVDRYESARALWLFRDYQDVANSSMRKWENSTRAISLVCEGQTGGGWFQDGISPQTLEVLRSVYNKSLSPHDLLCLVWWARNNLFFEQGLQDRTDFKPVFYDALVEDIEHRFAEIMDFLSIPFRPWTISQVHGESVRRHGATVLDQRVEQLCRDLRERLIGAAAAG